MEEIQKRLTDKDDKAAYAFAKQIGIESAVSDQYLGMIPVFAEMLQDQSSYVRTRAFILICNQARWANDGQIEAVFERMRPLLNDPKPTAVRQCLGALREVILFRPELTDRIEKVLTEIDPGKYQPGMSPLIEKDLASLRKLLDERL